jgi:hypothetical protein
MVATAVGGSNACRGVLHGRHTRRSSARRARVVDGRASADVLVSPRTLPDPSSPRLSRGVNDGGARSVNSPRGPAATAI